MRAVL